MSDHGRPIATSVSEILARIQESRVELDRLVDSIGDEDLVREPPSGGWPPIGHLMHMAAWERMIVAHLADGTDYEVVRMTPQEYERASLDELNARIYELHRHETPAETRAEFAAAHEAIVRCIERLTPDDLAQSYWPGDARSVAEKIAGDTYLHYDEHLVWITELLEAGS
jgi:hypothetical protein